MTAAKQQPDTRPLDLETLTKAVVGLTLVIAHVTSHQREGSHRGGH